MISNYSHAKKLEESKETFTCAPRE